MLAHPPAPQWGGSHAVPSYDLKSSREAFERKTRGVLETMRERIHGQPSAGAGDVPAAACDDKQQTAAAGGKPGGGGVERFMRRPQPDLDAFQKELDDMVSQYQHARSGAEGKLRRKSPPPPPSSTAPPPLHPTISHSPLPHVTPPCRPPTSTAQQKNTPPYTLTTGPEARGTRSRPADEPESNGNPARSTTRGGGGKKPPERRSRSGGAVKNPKTVPAAAAADAKKPGGVRPRTSPSELRALIKMAMLKKAGPPPAAAAGDARRGSARRTSRALDFELPRARAMTPRGVSPSGRGSGNLTLAELASPARRARQQQQQQQHQAPGAEESLSFCCSNSSGGDGPPRPNGPLPRGYNAKNNRLNGKGNNYGSRANNYDHNGKNGKSDDCDYNGNHNYEKGSPSPGARVRSASQRSAGSRSGAPPARRSATPQPPRAKPARDQPKNWEQSLRSGGGWGSQKPAPKRARQTRSSSAPRSTPQKEPKEGLDLPRRLRDKGMYAGEVSPATTTRSRSHSFSQPLPGGAAGAGRGFPVYVDDAEPRAPAQGGPQRPHEAPRDRPSSSPEQQRGAPQGCCPFSAPSQLPTPPRKAAERERDLPLRDAGLADPISPQRCAELEAIPVPLKPYPALPWSSSPPNTSSSASGDRPYAASSPLRRGCICGAFPPSAHTSPSASPRQLDLNGYFPSHGSASTGSGAVKVAWQPARPASVASSAAGDQRRASDAARMSDAQQHTSPCLPSTVLGTQPLPPAGNARHAAINVFPHLYSGQGAGYHLGLGAADHQQSGYRSDAASCLQAVPTTFRSALACLALPDDNNAWNAQGRPAQAVGPKRPGPPIYPYAPRGNWRASADDQHHQQQHQQYQAQQQQLQGLCGSDDGGPLCVQLLQNPGAQRGFDRGASSPESGRGYAGAGQAFGASPRGGGSASADTTEEPSDSEAAHNAHVDKMMQRIQVLQSYLPQQPASQRTCSPSGFSNDFR
ncbi:hypothetical protein DIPPA_32851 [Diplonema papillatum]|nr:hypothetical protein DIPPA_32851 [Diplonema papillatum]